MAVLIALLALALVIAAFVIWRWQQAHRIEHARHQAQLRVVEGQLGALRAVLRIKAAGYTAQRLMNQQADDVHASWPNTHGNR
jgi:fumarate reductase subunit D